MCTREIYVELIKRATFQAAFYMIDAKFMYKCEAGVKYVGRVLIAIPDSFPAPVSSRRNAQLPRRHAGKGHRVVFSPVLNIVDKKRKR